ncbi:hypothetical protein DGG96_14455 [Legionella qingyii]|uniref:Uncharacterized protein n=1 Tax=Legionella qingyii TaxID=2184757 RepID=A0A317U3L1_9GAMM|nr:hypothetical protein DGG96_14455 [Legionella qingyii]
MNVFRLGIAKAQIRGQILNPLLSTLSLCNGLILSCKENFAGFDFLMSDFLKATTGKTIIAPVIRKKGLD